MGRDRDDAFQQYHRLMGEPRQRYVASGSRAGVIDAFLEWVYFIRLLERCEWYGYRLQQVIKTYPDLRASDVRPYHVETWADGYGSALCTEKGTPGGCPPSQPPAQAPSVAPELLKCVARGRALYGGVPWLQA